ncbi:MAG: polyribonucleotide nucleotidyltransferase [Ilumatobacteraceae bacterium]
MRSLTKKLVRKRIVDEGLRIDGRGLADLRPVSAEVGLLPTAHGSGLFQRGETQVLNVCTLAMPRMNQLLDTLSPETTKRYLHHYNMPPYANGETGRVGSPKRREIGHGALAARAVLPVVPSQEEFAYTLRLVSEVLSSNGSTSMGSVCASSLSLMDAGVPIAAPVAGIAMGLVYEGGEYFTLTDILGAEDAFGDMDFKVAGTSEVVTALQLDTKIDGIPADVLTAALGQARDARLTILDVMTQAIDAPRAEVAASRRRRSPRSIIPLDKVGEVIGPKGKVINTIQSETGADISVDDDGAQGIVTIGAVEAFRMEEAKAQPSWPSSIRRRPSSTRSTAGRVVNITKFGAFVNILPGRDGLVHISKLGGGRRINAVEDVLSLGDTIEVRVEEIDDKGKVSLVPVGELAGGGGGDGSSALPDGAVSRPRSDRGGDRRSDRGDDRGDRRGDRGDRSDRGDRRSDPASSGNGNADADTVAVSFEDSFDGQLRDELGDLGPASSAPPRDDSDSRSRGRRRHR